MVAGSAGMSGVGREFRADRDGASADGPQLTPFPHPSIPGADDDGDMCVVGGPRGRAARVRSTEVGVEALRRSAHAPNLQVQGWGRTLTNAVACSCAPPVASRGK